MHVPLERLAVVVIVGDRVRVVYWVEVQIKHLLKPERSDANTDDDAGKAAEQ